MGLIRRIEPNANASRSCIRSPFEDGKELRGLLPWVQSKASMESFCIKARWTEITKIV